MLKSQAEAQQTQQSPPRWKPPHWLVIGCVRVELQERWAQGPRAGAARTIQTDKQSKKRCDPFKAELLVTTRLQAPGTIICRCNTVHALSIPLSSLSLITIATRDALDDCSSDLHLPLWCIGLCSGSGTKITILTNLTSILMRVGRIQRRKLG